MRAFAKIKYGLDLSDYYLPTGSLELGIDVLQIMRNIHVFVKRYLLTYVAIVRYILIVNVDTLVTSYNFIFCLLC